jgi:hypothetical protein
VGVGQLREITLVAFSGSKIPAWVLDGGTIFSTKTRFSRGIKRFAISETNKETKMKK